MHSTKRKKQYRKKTPLNKQEHMLIAQLKRKENIAEFILYMWQVEDIIRSLDFDLERIQQNIVDKYKQPENIKSEIRLWYKNLVEKMMQQGIHEKGHLQENEEILKGLQSLHLALLTAIQPAEYISAYNAAQPQLNVLATRSEDKNQTDVSLAFNALYGIFILKLKKQPISAETIGAMGKISKWISYLSAYFKKFETGELKIPQEKKN